LWQKHKPKAALPQCKSKSHHTPAFTGFWDEKLPALPSIMCVPVRVVFFPEKKRRSPPQAGVTGSSPSFGGLSTSILFSSDLRSTRWSNGLSTPLRGGDPTASTGAHGSSAAMARARVGAPVVGVGAHGRSSTATSSARGSRGGQHARAPPPLPWASAGAATPTHVGAPAGAGAATTTAWRCHGFSAVLPRLQRSAAMASAG
jgi:hypothetical protein